MSVTNGIMHYQNQPLNYIQDMCRKSTMAPENFLPCLHMGRSMNDPKALHRSIEFLCSRKLLVKSSHELYVLCQAKVDSYVEAVWKLIKNDICVNIKTEQRKEFCRRAQPYMKDPQTLQVGVKEACRYRIFSKQIDDLCKSNKKGVDLDSKLKKVSSVLIRNRRSLSSEEEYIQSLEEASTAQAAEITRNRDEIRRLREEINILKSSGGGEKAVAPRASASKISY